MMILGKTLTDVLQWPQSSENSVISKNKRRNDEIGHQGDKRYPLAGKKGHGRGLQSETDRSRLPALFEDRFGELIYTGVHAGQFVLLCCQRHAVESSGYHHRRYPR